jgi:amidase
MNRRELLKLSVAGMATAAAGGKAPEGPPPFEYAGKSLKQLQALLKDGSVTSASLCQAYLKRIEQLNSQLHAVLEVNPDALPAAEALDAERKDKKPLRGPLHGIPVLLKDSIETGDKMQTTAGSMALMGTPAKNDAFIVKKLRDAGAIILGKANMSEWSNIRSSRATSGWSARGGQGKNPYALDRSPIGSSSGSGIAVAADLCAVAVGCETDGSIICPSSAMALVGMKPTVGLLSRAGLIPIAHSQDTAGPMGRTVEDVAAMLAAMAGPDNDDPATKAHKLDEELGKLDKETIKGKRLGVVRNLMGKGPHVMKAMEQALKDLTGLGAVLVDVELPPMDNDAELDVLLFELKADLADYFKKRRPDAAMKTLADVIAFNEKNADREMPFFAQELFVKAQAKGPLTSPDYKKAVDACKKKGKSAIDAALAKNKLDAFVTQSMDPAWLIDPVLGDGGGGVYGGSHAAVAGYPSLTVPAGEAMGGLPIGLLFFGPAWSDGLLLKLGFAYEAATSHRKLPTFAATVTPKF